MRRRIQNTASNHSGLRSKLWVQFAPLLFSFGPVPSCILTVLLCFRETRGSAPGFFWAQSYPVLWLASSISGKTWGFAPGFSRLCRSTPILELPSYLGRKLSVQAGKFWNKWSNSVYFNYLSFRCKTTVACTVSLKICTNLWDCTEIPRRMLRNKDAQHRCSTRMQS
jgi:hypothetical protein